MEDKHFILIYRYVFICTLVVLGYVIVITFLPIPEKNQRFVDIALAFLLGWVSGNSQYLTGGNPTGKKPDSIIASSQNTTINTKKDEADNSNTTDINNTI